MATRIQRTDSHRPGAIIPRNYTPIGYYYLSPYTGTSGVVYEGPGVKKARELMNSPLVFSRADGTVSRLGKCDVCGANFNEGALLLHTPEDGSAEAIINVGHNCADKYAVQASWSNIELQAHAHQKAKKAMASAMKNKLRQEAFHAAHPEMAPIAAYLATFNTDQPVYMTNQEGSNLRLLTSIMNDIPERDLSEKQLAAAVNIYHSLTAVKTKPTYGGEVKAEAPQGRQAFTGKVISVKLQETDFGDVHKMTLKVTTPTGVWLAWGTLPASLSPDEVLGKDITLTGTLSHGREKSFAFFSRPSNASVMA